MPTDDEFSFPGGVSGERDLLLTWLRYLRGAVLRNLEGLDEVQARWTPDGRLIALLGIVNHLTNVECRWIDGGFAGATVTREESEFRPGPELSVNEAVRRYLDRAVATNVVVRSLSLDTPHPHGLGVNLRWVLLHLINETARHAGHADATREMLDGTTGE
ncbi:MAG: DUF664 domain-containing protein [Acidimicrobiales bacterium]